MFSYNLYKWKRLTGHSKKFHLTSLLSKCYTMRISHADTSHTEGLSINLQWCLDYLPSCCQCCWHIRCIQYWNSHIHTHLPTKKIVIEQKNLLTFQMIHECCPVRQSSFSPNWFHPPPHPRQYSIAGLLLFRHSASPRIWGSLCRNLFKDSYSKKVWNRPIQKALTTHYQLVSKASCIEGKKTTNLTIFAELQNHITCTCQNFVAVPPYQLDFLIMQANAYQGRCTSLSTNATSNCNQKKVHSYLLGAVAFSSSARYLATQRMPFPHICNWHRKFKLSLNRSWKQSSRIQKLIETINKTLQCAQIKCTINQKNCDKMECHQCNRPGQTATQYDNMSTLSRSLMDTTSMSPYTPARPWISNSQ